jgi:hypothetical protein
VGDFGCGVSRLYEYSESPAEDNEDQAGVSSIRTNGQLVRFRVRPENLKGTLMRSSFPFGAYLIRRRTVFLQTFA